MRVGICADCDRPVLYCVCVARKERRARLRDEFAMAALTSAGASKFAVWGLSDNEQSDVAAGCFKMADEMLAARENK